MNRRSFFGAAGAAMVAGPASAAPASGVQTLRLAFDAAPLKMATAELASFVGQAARFHPVQVGGERHYIYRTGIPAIDALRSISGVHKERMEKRLLG